MVEADTNQNSHIDQSTDDAVILEQNAPLEHKYVVWAMVKQQKQYQTEDMSETYISSNK